MDLKIAIGLPARCERSLCCVASIVRVATCEYRSVQKYFLLSFFDSAQSKAFVISLLRRRVRRPPLTSERERDISILRKLTRKLNRSNFPSPLRVFIISITIRTVSIGAVPIRGSSKIYTRREITPIITTLLHKFTISRYARYLCVIRRSLNVSRT